MEKFISIKGAREHNLKNVNVDIPRNQMVVITGLSGSGKSSLAFDTIYAEGQRRYVESLSAYARQFLDMMQKPDVDHIEGLSPAISIEQKTTSKNPRSTVGTVTEIYDYMRLLFARAGVPYSPATGLPIESQTVSQMVDKIMTMGSEKGTKLLLLAPVVRGRKGEYRKEFQAFRKRGFQRFKVDGKIYEAADVPDLDKNVKHTIEVVVDRLVVPKKPDKDFAKRLADSIEIVLGLSDGLLIIQDADTQKETLFSAKFACPESGFTIEEIEPRLFSFNNPYGACPQCDGLGTKMHFDPQLIIPDDRLTLREGAIAPWSKSASPYYRQTLDGLAKHYKIDLEMPVRQQPKEFIQVLLHGSGEENIKIHYDDGLRSYNVNRPFEGIIPNMMRRWKETDSEDIREEMGKYQSDDKCPACNGYRLKPETLAIKLDGMHIGQVAEKSITAAYQWFNTLDKKLNAKQKEIARRILKEICERLGFLESVGLNYLTLSRSSGTLSGGESQRIRLASQIASGLTGVLYVLDEPSIGLHQRDNQRLLTSLFRLKELGNSVIVVEHDEEAIRSADYVIDMGPGAGSHGGEIVAEGSLNDILKNPKSVTGKYLSGREEISMPKKRRTARNNQYVKLTGARANNLKNVSAEFPLGTFTCVTGVSGGGKSSLIIETLFKIMARKLNGALTHAGEHDKIEGLRYLDKVVDIDQSPIGRTPRSNPATYTGLFTPIRDWFTALPESKARGYNVGRFSFNVKGGRCEACQGDGVVKIEMHFLPDVYVQCDVCKGKRYNRETLEILYKDKSISDVLEMTVEEGLEFFKAVPAIRDKLEMLMQVGLSYIKLGQQATTLSGGEAQRIKLAKELSRKATGRTFYILDEPTTGLHFADIKKLLSVLQKLVDSGNTVLVIEHNMDVIKTADWIIDIGPEGGDKGGKIVAVGTPEQVAKSKDSYTGQYLKDHLGTKGSSQKKAS